jgi:hypothetical protein
VVADKVQTDAQVLRALEMSVSGDEIDGLAAAALSRGLSVDTSTGLCAPPTPSENIPLPFIVVNAHANTLVRIEMAKGSSQMVDAGGRVKRQRRQNENAGEGDIYFNFSRPFEIHDDNEILKRMELSQGQTRAQLEALIPKELIPFLPDGARPAILSDDDAADSGTKSKDASTPVEKAPSEAKADGAEDSVEAPMADA